MRKDTAMAVAEFVHYLQFVDILMTAIGATAFIIMAGSAYALEAQRIKIRKRSKSQPAPLSLKRGEKKISAQGLGAGHDHERERSQKSPY